MIGLLKPGDKMTLPSLSPDRFRSLLSQIHAGSSSAEEVLIQELLPYLRDLVDRILVHQFPRVLSWVEIDDVLNASVLRLIRAMHSVELASAEDLFRLASTQIRREALDLIKAHCSTHRADSPMVCQSFTQDTEHLAPVVGAKEEVQESEEWSDFQVAVTRLPAEERQVFELLFELIDSGTEVD